MKKEYLNAFKKELDKQAGLFGTAVMGGLSLMDIVSRTKGMRQMAAGGARPLRHFTQYAMQRGRYGPQSMVRPRPLPIG